MTKWYGLYASGDLIMVRSFNRKPTVLDFGSYLSSRFDYEIWEVEIVRIIDDEAI